METTIYSMGLGRNYRILWGPIMEFRVLGLGFSWLMGTTWYLGPLQGLYN